MTYYSQRKSILNGEPQAINNRYGNRRAMERQFHLYCANACDGEENPYDIDSIEWGTVEHGMIERKVYVKEVQPEPEPEVNGDE
ncbi:MAG: hypothetical protein IJH78_06670 [Clostridia bacterium]|nr:hypothetical protein [Clostridia bacterium]